MTSPAVVKDGGLTALAKTIPPEAILRAVEVVGAIVIGALQMESDRERFEQDLERLRHQDFGQRERLTLLVQLVDHTKISNEARDKIVAAICELALR